MRLFLAVCLPVLLASLPQNVRAEPCDLSGVWAVQYTVPLSWRFNAGLEGGSGQYVLQALLHRQRGADGSYADVLQICSRTMPTTKTLALYGSERYGSRFADAVFDAGVLPLAATTLRVAGDDGGPGAAFCSDATAFLLGLALPDPLRDAFPRRTADAQAMAIDVDGDGRPGLSMQARTDAGLSLPPVNPRRSKRAVSFDVVMRDVLAAHGTLVSCDELRGTGEVVQVAGRAGLQATVVGCALQDGSDCVRSDLGIVNSFQPNFTPRPGEVQMRRLSVGAQCAEVRASW